jgi:hypothetical protein
LKKKPSSRVAVRATTKPPVASQESKRDERLAQSGAAFDRHLEMSSTSLQAMEGLSKLFGGLPYVNNEEIALEGLTFIVRAVEYEAGQGYKGGDRWNLSIVTQFGEPKALTLATNPTRSAYMTALAKVVHKYGDTPPLALQAIPFTDKSTGEELTFYAVVLANEWKGDDRTIAGNAS